MTTIGKVDSELQTYLGQLNICIHTNTRHCKENKEPRELTTYHTAGDTLLTQYILQAFIDSSGSFILCVQLMYAILHYDDYDKI